MIRKFLNYFLNGLLIALPIGVIGYFLYHLFIFLDELIWLVFGDGERKFKGLGIIILVILLSGLGYLGSTFIAKPIQRAINRFFDRIPLIKTIYEAINDLLSAFVGQKKRFNQPVLVRVSKDSELEKIGFITDTDLEQLGEIEGKVAVYFPHSYNFSGNLFIVPVENIKPIHKKPSDVMKYIVSGGVSHIDEKEDGAET